MNLSFSTQFPANLHPDIANQPTHFVERILASIPYKNVQQFYYDTYNVDFLSLEFIELLRIKANYHFNNDVYTLFKKIATPKKHTIRTNKKGLWKPGNTIHFFINPRSAFMFQFAPLLKCTAVQPIEIITQDHFKLLVNGLEKGEEFQHRFAHADGFTSLREFKHYFCNHFNGSIIHWTNGVY